VLSYLRVPYSYSPWLSPSSAHAGGAPFYTHTLFLVHHLLLPTHLVKAPSTFCAGSLLILPLPFLMQGSGFVLDCWFCLCVLWFAPGRCISLRSSYRVLCAWCHPAVPSAKIYSSTLVGFFIPRRTCVCRIPSPSSYSSTAGFTILVLHITVRRVPRRDTRRFFLHVLNLLPMPPSAMPPQPAAKRLFMRIARCRAFGAVRVRAAAGSAPYRYYAAFTVDTVGWAPFVSSSLRSFPLRERASYLAFDVDRWRFGSV